MKRKFILSTLGFGIASYAAVVTNETKIVPRISGRVIKVDSSRNMTWLDTSHSAIDSCVIIKPHLVAKHLFSAECRPQKGDLFVATDYEHSGDSVIVHHFELLPSAN